MILFYLTNMVSGGSGAVTPANYTWAPVALAGASTWVAMTGWAASTWLPLTGWGQPTWVPVDTSVN